MRNGLLNTVGLWLFLFSSSLWSQSPDQVLVIINDNSPDSQAIGYYYAGKRAIPAENLCRIQTDPVASISRERFIEEILRPVADCLESRLLMDQVLYLVTTRGVPLLIEGRGGPVGDAGAVDSELCMLYTYLLYNGYNHHGRAENHYFSVDYTTSHLRPFLRSQQTIYLVSRLTGPNVEQTLRLINRGFQSGNPGQFYLDLPSERTSVAKEWFERTEQRLREADVSVALEKTVLRAEVTRAALGLTVWPSDENSGDSRIDWSPGGLALVFEQDSFHPQPQLPGEEQRRISLKDRLARLYHLVQDGATGVAGFLAGANADDHFRPQILFPAYASGHNLAESYYLSQRYLSWYSIVIGDPLVSPFAAKSTSQREELAEDMQTDVDPETDMPRYFSDRLRSWLQRRYSASEEAASLHVKARGQRATGRETEAENLLEKALLKDTYLSVNLLLLAEILEGKGEYEKALHHYLKVARIERPGADLYRKISELALRTGQPELAKFHGQWLYQRQGGDLLIRKLWANLQLEAGELNRARLIFQGLVQELDPPPFGVLGALGRIYAAEGHPEVAREFISQALDLAPASVNGNTAAGYRLSHEDPAYLQDLLSLLGPDSGQTAEQIEEDTTIEDEGEPGGTARGVVPAQVVYRETPKYPFEARRAGVQGRVLIRVLVGEKGELLKKTVVSGDRLLARAALRAVENWRFEPRQVRGRPEPSMLMVAVDFQLN